MSGPPADTQPADVVPTAQAVLRHVVAALVKDPDAVRVETDTTATRPVLTVRVGDSDMGRVIGRRGRTAHAIRTVVRAAAAQDGSDVVVEFED